MTTRPAPAALTPQQLDDTDEMAASLARDGFSPDEIATMACPGATVEPVQLRWGLNDVMWGDDDTVTVMLSGPDGEPYRLELDPERAAVLREDLAGPDGAPEPDTGTTPCGHDDYHDPHEWADRPHIWCPGISYDDEEQPAVVVPVASTNNEETGPDNHSEIAVRGWTA